MTALLVVGCFAPVDVADSETDQDPEASQADVELSGEQEVYRQGVRSVGWDDAELIVLIVPPAYGQPEPDQVVPFDSLFLRAVEDSITHWQEVVDEHASAPLRGNLSFEVYVLGRDVPSPGDLDRVDILIVHPPGGRLEVAGEKILLGGVAWWPLAGLDPLCVTANLVHPLLEYEWLFMVSAHEFGHCLGLAHPEDHRPWFDLMSYTERNLPPGQELPKLECVSNMNLRGVEEAFAHVFGQDGRDMVEMPASQYETFDCWERFHPDAQ